MPNNYKSLIKIIKNNLDAESSKLGRLQFELATFENQKKQKQEKLKQDAQIVGDETLIYLADFIKTLRSEIKMLDEFIQLKEKEIRKQEIVVRDIFIEKKKVEVVESIRDKKLKDELTTKENKEIEDLTINLWNYNK